MIPFVIALCIKMYVYTTCIMQPMVFFNRLLLVPRTSLALALCVCVVCLSEFYFCCFSLFGILLLTLAMRPLFALRLFFILFRL